jgi:hypothetical protein
MVIIKFPNGTDWFKANWAFRQFAEDVAELFPTDGELKLELEKAEAFGALDFTSVENAVGSRIMKAMMRVANDTLQGTIPGWKRAKPADEAGQRMYIEAITELFALLKEADRE